LNDVAEAKVRERSRALLDDLGLRGCADRFPEDISGGEQQRAAIARAVIHEPKLVLADEPTGNLDAETAQHVLELLSRTCRERNATLIVATHSAEVASQAARVLRIRAGRIEEAGP
jgi:putative ABC transport system ATP-binding protein